MLRTAIFAAALLAYPAVGAECVYLAPSGATLSFTDPMTMVVADLGKTETCMLLSAGTGVMTSRGVACGAEEATRLEFLDKDMNVVRYRGVDWTWSCPDTPMDISLGN